LDDDFPPDLNGDVLRRMASRGDDLRIARDIDFSLLFDEEDKARAFCDQLGDAEARVKRYCTEAGEILWDVTVTIRMAPSHQGITEMENHLARLAGPLGGRNDGWGCFGARSH
jgi:hypothetical protein